MAGRYGGRFGTNQEQELRRIQKEPVVVWRKEWVLPSGPGASSNVKILKWVRTGDVTKFDEDEDVGEETMAMDVDASMLMEPEPPLPESAMDSLAATPAPPTRAETSTPAATQILPLQTESSNTPADSPSAVPLNDVAPAGSSQPLLTQPSIAPSSQGVLSSAASSQPAEPLL